MKRSPEEAERIRQNCVSPSLKAQMLATRRRLRRQLRSAEAKAASAQRLILKYRKMARTHELNVLQLKAYEKLRKYGIDRETALREVLSR